MKQRWQALIEQGKAYPNARELTNAIRTNSPFKEEIRDVYRLIFRRSLSGCSNCIADAFVELANVNPETIENQCPATTS